MLPFTYAGAHYNRHFFIIDEDFFIVLAKLKLYMSNINNSDDWSDDQDDDIDIGDTAVETAKPKLKKPRMYRVIINNDDYTPMEFVVHVLENFFSMDRAKATRIMLDVHNNGKGNCGLFPRDTAETKTLQVNDYSKEHNQPLMCSMEVD